MGLQRCTSTDAFVVTDLDDAPVADGVVRWARKVLVDGARTLARSRTYAWALLGEQVSGASAGVSAAPEGRAEAIAAFVTEVRPRVEQGALALDPAKGVAAQDLAGLDAVDTRSPLRHGPRPDGTLATELLAAGAVAAAGAALGGLEGRTVALEGAGTAGPALVRAVDAAGGRVVAIGTATGTVRIGDRPADEVRAAWAEHGDELPAVLGNGEAGDPAAVLSTEADVLCCGSRAGLIDHEVAAALDTRAVVPIGAVPVTARGLAVATRGGAVVLPDFLTTAGPLLAFRPPGGATAEELVVAAGARLAELTSAALAHELAFLGACGVAEDFLRTWRDELPFGRPLA